ncbi:hypothetical protein [Anaerocolumna chitinilytica]|uniref:Uncharacterized protein n=1 Tax=Anaerocolumna chitinilytica TaxID=1727145 RepID=A0A7I8DMK7_9FIRM|nr:hypothetical protein [Anaerocolumna chitinilytica]BCJ99663.1 hypothetical protein bsdcttw_27040 [Anaerocolumna chitinilytica]
MLYTIFQFIIMLLILFISGLFADRIYRLVAFCRKTSSVYTALIFSLIIFYIDILGLFIFKGITHLPMLIDSFDCLQFTRRFILVSLIVAAIIGGIAGVVGWLQCRLRRDA